jgi:hypothetical protein
MNLSVICQNYLYITTIISISFQKGISIESIVLTKDRVVPSALAAFAGLHNLIKD